MTKQQELDDTLYVLAMAGERVELIAELRRPGKTSDELKMLFDDALYPTGDAVSFLSLVKLKSFFVTLQQLPCRDRAVALITPR